MWRNFQDFFLFQIIIVESELNSCSIVDSYPEQSFASDKAKKKSDFSPDKNPETCEKIKNFMH